MKSKSEKRLNNFERSKMPYWSTLKSPLKNVTFIFDVLTREYECIILENYNNAPLQQKSSW